MSLHGTDTDQTYARAGFGAPVEPGTRPAIVVVDLTNGFTDPAADTGAELSAEVAATTELITAGRGAGVPVVFTTIGFTAAELAGGVAWLRKAPGMASLRIGSRAVEIDARLPRTEDDQLILKKGASAFFGTGLAALLTALRVDTVLVCGATTSGCVRATAVDAVQSGFTVLVPRQCVGDRAQGPHEANLFDIQAKYGDVIELSEAISYLSGLTSAVSV
ncbi:MAG TPA: isochorismatase family protein [Pseudonocardia sp.]|jgi:nicotinamidase-related amidase|nr:isochorismatase family protein [Pseudonocardia sp.]